MAERYDHKAIEKKWQDKWVQDGVYNTPDADPVKENFYFLTEFPYPSGNLHVGHWYAFAVPDIFARYMRMRGYNVLYPIGFDAFGLPAENAAIKNKVNPREWTQSNIEYMRSQLRSMGASFDWSREVITADPSYYKWTQWLFLQFFKKGLAYRKETAVNWCPNDKTVLANEQVVDGKCERCGHEVEQRLMPQWNLKITDYADRLIDDLKDLDWPKQIKDAQINWIGRSEGAEIDFKLTSGDMLTVFTTRPDTLFGATYMVVAPEHPIVSKFADGEVQKYVTKASKKTELERAENKDKTGVELRGVKAINPATKEEIPIYVADYVLGGYGTGAIMAVPAHDERDFEFAKKFNLPVVQVVAPVHTRTSGTDAVRPEAKWVDRNAVMCVVKHWEKDEYLVLQWKDHPEVRTFIAGGIEEGENPLTAGAREITEETGYKNPRFVRQIGGVNYSEFYHQIKNVNRRARFTYLYYELADGARQELSAEDQKIHDVLWKPKNEVLAFVSNLEKDMVWNNFLHEEPYIGVGLLINSGQFDGAQSEEAKKKIVESVGGRLTKQYHLRDWVVSRQRYWGVPIPVVHCAKCGYQPVEEAELPVLLPEVEDYLPTGDGKSPLAKVKSFVDTRCPKCGGPAERETDTLDTFVDSSWYFERYTDPKNDREFASKERLAHWLPVDLYSGGSEHTTMHVLYSRFWHKAMYDLGLVGDSEPYLRRMNRGLIMGPDGQKMSKRWGNVIDPDDEVKRVGADAVRTYLAFIGPFNEVGAYPWNPGGIVGVRRFLDRAWRLAPADSAPSARLEQLLHRTIKKVGDDIASLKMNTAVSALMILLNELEKEPAREAHRLFTRLLYPFAPHLASELAQMHGVDLTAWPEFNAQKSASTSAVVAVQVNGKVRTTIELAPDAPEGEALEAAQKAALKWLTGPLKAHVYRPGRVINLLT